MCTYIPVHSCVSKSLLIWYDHAAPFSNHFLDWKWVKDLATQDYSHMFIFENCHLVLFLCVDGVKYFEINIYDLESSIERKSHHITEEHSHCTSTATVVVVILSVSLPCNKVLTPLQYNYFM